MASFISLFEDIRYRFFLEEEEEKTLINELIEVGKTHGHFVFLFQAPNMSGYDLGFVPHGIKPKDTDRFITCVLGCGYVCKLCVSRSDKFHVQLHGRVEDPRCNASLMDGNIIMTATLMHCYDFSLSATRTLMALEDTLVEVAVEKDRLYYGDLTRDRRVIKSDGLKVTDYKGIPLYTLGDLFCKYQKKVQRKKK